MMYCGPEAFSYKYTCGCYLVVWTYYPFHIVKGVGLILGLGPNIFCIFLAYIYCLYEKKLLVSVQSPYEHFKSKLFFSSYITKSGF